MKILLKPIAIILSNCLLVAQIKTGPDIVKVAYIGLQVENVDSWVKTELETKLNLIFNGLDPEQLIKPNEVNKLAKEEVESLFLDINDNSFQKIADKTGAQYIFAGKFKNVSPDESRIMIQGDFYRYNAELKTSFRYEVLKYYERMNDEAKVIQQQMVDSIPYTPKPASLRQVFLVFGGIILIGLVFMTLSGTNVWQDGESGDGGTKPTEN